MNVKSHSKEVCSLTNLMLLLLLISKTVAIATCDRRLMNEFGLSGMKIAVSDSMKVCGHIKDKCCTVTDEIKITKLWNSYTMPFLMRYSGEYSAAMQQIVQSYYKLMKIDPRLIMLKYVAKKEVPYNYKLCSSRIHKETDTERKEFLMFHDSRLEYELAPSFYRLETNQGKSFDLKQYTHDDDNRRHWDVKYPYGHYSNRRKILNNYKADFPIPKVDSVFLTCNQFSHTYFKEFIVVNDKKTDFCLSLYDKFLNLNIKHLKKYLRSVKNNINQIHQYKSSLYCLVCNAHEQQYFDPINKTITISQDFCRMLLIEKEGYLKFAHILFVEFMDSLLQYVQCFETDAKVYNFPFLNFLTKYKRRIPFIKNCFENLESKNFMKYCWFICEKYDLMRVSPFFDGEVKLLRRVQIAIFSFIRKMEIETTRYNRIKNKPFLLAKTNVNGMLVEPLNPSHLHTQAFYLAKKERKKLLGKLDTRMKLPHKQAYDLLDKFLKALGHGSLKSIENLRKAYKKLLKKNKKLEKSNKLALSQEKMTKKMKKKLKRLVNNENKKYNPISKLYNYLWKVKFKHKLHGGYFPQRKLINDTKIKSKLLNAFTRVGYSRKLIEKKIAEQDNLSESEVPVNNATTTKKNITDNKEDIEVPHQLFEKNREGYKIKTFKLKINEDGANPLQHFVLVDYKFNITSLIGLKFRYEEELDRDTVFTYLRSTPKDINEFNFDASQYFMSFLELGSSDKKYIAAKKIYKYARRKHRSQLANKAKQKIRNFEHKKHKELKHEKDRIAFKKAKKKSKEIAQKHKQMKKVEANHHVDFPTYKKNFFDIKEFFVHLFGS